MHISFHSTPYFLLNISRKINTQNTDTSTFPNDICIHYKNCIKTREKNRTLKVRQLYKMLFLYFRTKSEYSEYSTSNQMTCTILQHSQRKPVTSGRSVILRDIAAMVSKRSKIPHHSMVLNKAVPHLWSTQSHPTRLTHVIRPHSSRSRSNSH